MPAVNKQKAEMIVSKIGSRYALAVVDFFVIKEKILVDLRCFQRIYFLIYENGKIECKFETKTTNI